MDRIADGIRSCSIDTECKTVELNIEDNLDKNNEMLVYTRLLYLQWENITIPKVIVSMYNRKGDIYLQYTFKNLKVINLNNDNMNLDYDLRGNDSILRIYTSLRYEKCKIKFVTNGQPVAIKEKKGNGY